MFRKVIVFFLFVLVLSGCSWLNSRSAGTRSASQSEMQQPIFDKLVSQDVLDAGSLELVWQSIVPLKKDETIKMLKLIDNRIYALSSQNFLASLNRENGEPVFSRDIGQPNFAVLGLDIYDDELYSVIGNRLTQVDNGTGQPISEKSFPYGIACPAARNENYFYLGASDRTVRAIKADNKVEVYKVAAESAAPITAVLADENFFIFSTEAGDVISVAPDKALRLWPFTASGEVLGPLVRDAVNLYFASKDTNIYCLSIRDGILKWKFPSGMIPASAPVITADYLYQNAGDKGLFALDKATSQMLWQITDAKGLLAELSGAAYIFTKSSTLLILDNKSGKTLNTINLSGINIFASNTVDSRMYISDGKTGRIACLRPIVRKVER